jgi:DNA-binding PadR family transcriptional regulator
MHLLTKQEELLLLTIFRIQRDAYLVNIREHLKKHIGKEWAFGSIYITLEKLCRKGFVKNRIGIPTATQGGKAIKYYDLTESGIRILKDNKHLHDKMWKEFAAYTQV